MQTSAAPSSTDQGRSGLPASRASRDRFFDDAWLQHSKLLGMRCFAFLVRVFALITREALFVFSRGLALPRGQINI
jgi:hypothetical protein